ncbi:MAG TPA: hypothetical protein VG498_14445 [Terriglobales bacterium]|nr:hypothetical protein [Terriglobales bacterium]
MRRAILAFAALIALHQTAAAGVSCTVVRFYVAKYSEATAEAWARSHGASDAEIEAARRCLHHNADVQTAGLAEKSPRPAPVIKQDRAQPEPVKSDPDQEALHVTAVEGQHADAERDDSRKQVQGSMRPKIIEDGSAGHVSETKNLVRSDGKTDTLRPRYVGAAHRGGSAGVRGHVAWLKGLWDQLVGRRRSSIAFFSFRSRSYNKLRPVSHHLSGTVPAHGAG